MGCSYLDLGNYFYFISCAVHLSSTDELPRSLESQGVCSFALLEVLILLSLPTFASSGPCFMLSSERGRSGPGGPCDLPWLAEPGGSAR